MFFIYFKKIKYQYKIPVFLFSLSFFTGITFVAYKLNFFNDIFTGLSSDDSQYIRALMTLKGFYLTYEFFPFGVGSGTFGTLMSNYQTTEVYEYVGINLRYFTNYDGSLRGVYDSSISSFLAENGVLGLLIMFFFIKKINFLFKKIFNNQMYKIYMLLISYSLLLTISDPINQNGFFTVFFILSLLKLYSNQLSAK